MPIRMIAADLDGTLLNRDRQVTQRTVNALRAAMDCGALVVLCSGRMPQSMTDYADAVGVNAPIISYNGALTLELHPRRVWSERLLDRDTARGLCGKIEQIGRYVQAFWGDKYYYEARADETLDYERKAAVIGEAIGVRLSEFIPCGVYKVLMIVENGTIGRYLPGLRASYGHAVDLAPSSGSYLECVASGVNKGAALLKLGAARGIAPSEIMAFGDEQNDLSMLTLVGHGYAMANADESIRRQVRFVAPSNGEDGVAQVVERCLRDRLFAPPREEARI